MIRSVSLPALAAVCALLLASFPASHSQAQLSVLPSPSATIEMPVGTGRLVRFQTSATEIFVANPGVADVQSVSPGLAYLTGVGPGITDVFAVDGEERVIGSFRVTVRQNSAAVADINRGLVEPSGLSVEFSGETPVLRGDVRDVSGALEADALRRSVGPSGSAFDATRFLGPTQVNLRVRFAEVSRTDISRLGVNFDVLADVGAFAFGIATGSSVAGVAGVADGFAASVDSFANLGAGVSTSFLNADVLIDALASNGIVEVLAEPTLTTVSGRTASFLAGGEFPIIVPQDEGTFTTEFRDFGVSLKFRPTLLPEGRISLEVAPEVSTLDQATGVSFNGFEIPGLRVRRAETTVELASGQSFAIAGLFQRNLADVVRGLPGVQDLPVLGALFRSRRFQSEETELVILITPYLVGDTPAARSERLRRSAGSNRLAGYILNRGTSRD